ncbi:YbjN domain-containing protein [Gallaecimonas sp. GXIMD4217]|uniref:YbjN domain-containing protein n=1 Tax=Gallaecimonas sp. GXIMD4217 TaxID=3131927 RepID=UPI00311AC80D
MYQKILPLAALALLSTQANAAMITAKDPQAILNIAKGYGSAVLEKDSAGDPKIRGRIEGIGYSIFFYGCKDGKSCDDIQFNAGWSGTEVTLSDVNRWNSQKKFGKAFIDSEGDPILQMAVNIDHGVSEMNLEDTFNWWQVAMKGFKQEVLGL